MTVIQRIVAGDEFRRTRFHDEKGNLVGCAGWINAPHAFLTTLASKLVGYRPRVPWISYRGRRTIAKLIQPDSRVIEFGSGMSTVWLSRRCNYLHSIESDRRWYEFVARQMTTDRNVRYEYRSFDCYAELKEYADESVDFSLIDGIVRSRCAIKVIPKIKRGGYVYLDNSDKDTRVVNGDLRLAENALADAARARGGSVRYFVDFAPCNGSATQGMLVRL